MYRTVFRSALRQAPRARLMSTATPRASSLAPKLAIGGSLVAASIFLLPFSPVNSDANKSKVAKDKEAAKEATKTTENEEKSEPTESELPESQDEEPQSAAFNPETGEINWDCPCLGGMAHGPCGEEFKEAFACFVYSETEPKGIDCITKFEAMRTCFKQHPEHYKEELYEDDEPVTGLEPVDVVAEVEIAEVEVAEIPVGEIPGEVEVVETVEISEPEHKKTFDERFQVESESDPKEPGVVEVVTADLA